MNSISQAVAAVVAATATIAMAASAYHFFCAEACSTNRRLTMAPRGPPAGSRFAREVMRPYPIRLQPAAIGRSRPNPFGPRLRGGPPR